MNNACPDPRNSGSYPKSPRSRLSPARTPKVHNFCYLGVCPGERHSHLFCREVTVQQEKIVLEARNNCGNLLYPPSSSLFLASSDCYTPTPEPPIGSALCPSMSIPFTKIASTRVGCPFTAMLITRSFSLVKVL